MSWEGSTRRVTLPADWPARRKAALKRDKHRCRIAGPTCTGKATQVDHIGERNDHRLHMLRSVCVDCHNPRSGWQGGTSSGEARRARVRARSRPAEPHPGELP